MEGEGRGERKRKRKRKGYEAYGRNQLEEMTGLGVGSMGLAESR